MSSKLILAVLTMAAVVAAPQVYAQSVTGTVPPATNQAAKQDKRVAPPQATAPKTTARKPAAKNTNAVAAEQAKQQPAQADAARSGTNTRLSKEVPRIQPSQLGRVPVENGGTFGFSSETKMKMYETPDGQRLRGMDHAITSSRPPSYFGLSLSVPTFGSSGGSDGPSGLPPPPRN